MIRKGTKKVHLYKGDYKPIKLYKGTHLVADYDVEEATTDFISEYKAPVKVKEIVGNTSLNPVFKIRGKNIKYSNNFSPTASSGSVSGVSFSSTDDKEYSITGTATASSNITQLSGTLTTGHKAIIIIHSENSFTLNYQTPNTIITVHGINSYLYYIRTVKDEVYNTTIKPMFVDLTFLYGAGNEPTTTQQFYIDHPEYLDYVEKGGNRTIYSRFPLYFYKNNELVYTYTNTDITILQDDAELYSDGTFTIYNNTASTKTTPIQCYDFDKIVSANGMELEYEIIEGKNIPSNTKSFSINGTKYDYDLYSGEKIDCLLTPNIWDEESEVGDFDYQYGTLTVASDRFRTKNYIDVSPNTQYYFYKITSVSLFRIFYYDENGISQLGASSLYQNTNNALITTPNWCHKIRFWCYGTTYNHDICFNLSNPAINGNYYPFNDGSKYIQSHLYNKQNLKLLTWTYQNNLFKAPFNLAKVSETPYLINSAYPSSAVENQPNKTIAYDGSNLIIRDDDYDEIESITESSYQVSALSNNLNKNTTKVNVKLGATSLVAKQLYDGSLTNLKTWTNVLTKSDFIYQEGLMNSTDKIDIISGHKYLYLVYGGNASYWITSRKNEVTMYFYVNGTYANGSSGKSYISINYQSGNVDRIDNLATYGLIFTANTTSSVDIGIYFYRHGAIKHIMIVDLTDTYGLGKEVTTMDLFLNDFPEFRDSFVQKNQSIVKMNLNYPTYKTRNLFNKYIYKANKKFNNGTQVNNSDYDIYRIDMGFETQTNFTCLCKDFSLFTNDIEIYVTNTFNTNYKISFSQNLFYVANFIYPKSGFLSDKKYLYFHLKKTLKDKFCIYPTDLGKPYHYYPYGSTTYFETEIPLIITYLNDLGYTNFLTYAIDDNNYNHINFGERKAVFVCYKDGDNIVAYETPVEVDLSSIIEDGYIYTDGGTITFDKLGRQAITEYIKEDSFIDNIDVDCLYEMKTPTYDDVTEDLEDVLNYTSTPFEENVIEVDNNGTFKADYYKEK